MAGNNVSSRERRVEEMRQITRRKSHYESIQEIFHPTPEQWIELCDALAEARRLDEEAIRRGEELFTEDMYTW